jgi:hypothetical protein
MMAQASRDWSVFKQIFADHWQEFKQFRPRYDTPYYDSLVETMLDCGTPRPHGLYRIPLRAVRTRQASGVDEL